MGKLKMLKKILFLLGLLLWLFPILSNEYEKERQWDVIASYQKKLESFDRKQVEQCIKDAKEYNELLYRSKSTLGAEFQNYRDLLNLMTNGMMGSIEIPKIHVRLPIYHGTNEEELSKGIGHIPGTSLPVGGENTHCLLAGHRGLPETDLFLNLDQLKEGDLFTLSICGNSISYRICTIRVMEPDDIGVLALQEGKDLVSLITCTPYGINTHRLVVTGEREEHT